MNELIREIRESKGMNQQEFAETIGLAQSMLSMLESGERRPGRKTIKALMTVASTEQAMQILEALRDNGKGE